MVRNKNEKVVQAPSQTDQEKMLQWENYRFTVISERIVRMEYVPSGQFEDRATETVLNRNFSAVHFERKESETAIEIDTDHIRLTFQKQKGGFTKHNLKVEVIGNFSTYRGVWHFGEKFANLKGTARTLDWADGEIPLEDGLMNKNGFSVLDDSRSLVFAGDGMETREKGVQDFYFFGFGRDYLGTLNEFYQLTGKTPLVPRYALGNWWSRYYPYSAEEYQQLMQKFQQKEIPFSVAVIDMDWHLTNVPIEYGSGWTGYTWNKDLFPDPAGFINWVHEQGMHISLNLHPANGIQPHEEMYQEMAEELGIDWENKEPIPFDIADPVFLESYFRHALHPLEEMGVDFWWIDWQSGSISKIEGLDPLWMLNHYHYTDHERDGKLGLIFSRYAGIGSHRYPIGFSGDTIITWDSLKFQPYFTATASNVGYTWWSHDIGGHTWGYRDDELFVRWVQFGVFSPINRLHSTTGPFYSKEPWRYPALEESVLTNYLQLRHQLVPYLHTMNHLTNKEALPLVQPMYYHHPWENEAYDVPNQYYFGTQMLVVPITEKMSSITKEASTKIWLPEGTWFDFFSDQPYQGNRNLTIYRDLAHMPVFVKQGGIIPLSNDTGNNLHNPASMTLNVYPGANGKFTLYEDETYQRDADAAKVARTRFNWKWGGESNSAKMIIFPVEGDQAVVPAKRDYHIQFKSLQAKVGQVLINDEPVEASISQNNVSLEVQLLQVPADANVVVELEETKIVTPDLLQETFTFLDRIRLEHQTKEEIYKVVKRYSNKVDILSSLHSLDLPAEVIGKLVEMISAY